MAWISGALVAIVSLVAFPQKVEDAFGAGVKTIFQFPRILHASLNHFEFIRNYEAKQLISNLQPGVTLCVISANYGDLVGSGWNADLEIEYESSSTANGGSCDHPDSYDKQTMSAFLILDSFSYELAGNVTRSEGELPYSWSILDRFLIKEIYGTDFPGYEVWYIGNGVLKDANYQIKLTNNDAREYNLETSKIPRGILGWGIPDGQFYMTVSDKGEFESGVGLPEDMRRQDDQAVVLDWTDGAFKDGREIVDGKIKVGRLSHIYVSGCEAAAGFSMSPYFPGAIIPLFNLDTKLDCGGGEHDNGMEVTLVADEP